jgi:hypothetical protein
MDERRREERRFLTYFSRVVDRNNGRMLGYLVDMTTGGAMLVGNISLKLQQTYDVCVDLPDGFADLEQLDLVVRAVWIQPDTDPEFYRTGLQLVKIEPKTLLILERLLQKFSARS